MEWKSISNFLSNASKLVDANYLAKRAIRDTLSEIFHVDFSNSDVSVKDNIAYVKAAPLIKGEIILRKKDILASIQSKTGTKIADIR